MSWLARRFYDCFFWFVFTTTTFGYSIRIQGRRNIPKSGPVLLVSNHQSMFDPVIIGLASPRYLTYLARSSLFKHRIFAIIIRILGAFPIDRDFGKKGLNETLALLHDNRAVLVFPEGERTHDGQIEPFKAGISLIIKKMEMPIIPVGLTGAFAAWPRTRRWPRLAPLFLPASSANLAISIGNPISSREFQGLARAELIERLQQAVAAEVSRARRLCRARHCAQPS